MTWLAWRQVRFQSAAAAAGLLVVLGVLVATHGRVVAVDDPGTLPNWYQSLRLLGTGLVGVPAFLGAFWGAPLIAREWEAGTYRMIWTQSVPRGRWLLIRLAVIAAIGAVLTALFSFVFTWWSAPFDAFGNRIGTANFGQRGIAPVAYALFAIALGAFFGAVIRRTLPAITATLVAFTVVRMGFQLLVRPHLGGTTQLIRFTNQFAQERAANGWVHSAQLIGPSGHPASQKALNLAIRANCRITEATNSLDIGRCVNRLGFRDLVTVHPGSSFWTLQLWEAACFLLLAAALTALTVWWLRSRT